MPTFAGAPGMRRSWMPSCCVGPHGKPLQIAWERGRYRLIPWKYEAYEKALGLSPYVNDLKFEDALRGAEV
jgi:hypothetical protein